MCHGSSFCGLSAAVVARWSQQGPGLGAKACFESQAVGVVGSTREFEEPRSGTRSLGESDCLILTPYTRQAHSEISHWLLLGTRKIGNMMVLSWLA